MPVPSVNSEMMLMKQMMENMELGQEALGDRLSKEIKADMKAMGNEMAMWIKTIQREVNEVRECVEGVQGEMMAGQAKIKNKMKEIKMEVEGLAAGQKQLKIKIKSNTGATKELKQPRKKPRGELMAIKKECKMRHDEVTKKIRDGTENGDQRMTDEQTDRQTNER